MIHKSDQGLNLLRTYLILSLLSSLAGFVGLILAFNLAGGGSLVEVTWMSIWVFVLPGIFAIIFLWTTFLSFRQSTATQLLGLADRYLCHQTGLAVSFLIAFYFFLFSLIYSISASPNIDGPVYPVWMVPFYLWLLSVSGLMLVYLVVLRLGFSWSVMFTLSLVIGILLIGVGVSLQFWGYDSPRKEDIYFIYLDGERLLQGENPYERVLAGDMRVNDKYSTYFPGFYYLAWAIQKAGLRAFAEWLSFWRVISLVSNLSIAALLFYMPSRKRLVGLSFFAALFWLFNRWTLHVARTADIDFLALFFMLLSLFLFHRNRNASYLLLGLSLTIKQVAIFLVPVYLIWSWKGSPTGRLKQLVKGVLWIGIIPMLASLPFLIWNWEAFARSILFSATRIAVAANNVYSLDVALGWQGVFARIPMAIMLMLAYWIAWKYKLGSFSIALLVLAVFVFFNSVIFTSYMVWLVALIPMMAYEMITQLENGTPQPTG